MWALSAAGRQAGHPGGRQWAGLATSFAFGRRAWRPWGPSIFWEGTPTHWPPVLCLVSKSCQREQEQWWAQCSLVSRGSVTGQIQSVHKKPSAAHS